MLVQGRAVIILIILWPPLPSQKCYAIARSYRQYVAELCNKELIVLFDCKCEGWVEGLVKQVKVEAQLRDKDASRTPPFPTYVDQRGPLDCEIFPDVRNRKGAESGLRGLWSQEVDQSNRSPPGTAIDGVANRACYFLSIEIMMQWPNIINSSFNCKFTCPRKCTNSCSDRMFVQK